MANRDVVDDKIGAHDLVLALMAFIAFSIVMGFYMHQISQPHTYAVDAVYHDAGYLVDIYGEQYNVVFDVPDESDVVVTFDSKNTKSRLDDVPVKVSVID
jgi:hypothetical protein